MAIYTIRPNFTIVIDSGTYTGGQEVDLTPEEFDANKHKLEGVESDVPDIEIAGEKSCFPEPYISEISPKRLFLGFEAQLTITGSFFTPDTTVVVEGATVNSIEFVNSLNLKVDVTVGNSSGFSDVTINNGEILVSFDAIELIDPTNKIIDLRLGGTDFDSSAIEMRQSMSFTRTADGLYFVGENPWRSWARLVGNDDAWVWNRSEKRSLSLILADTSASMWGIGSRANNPNNNAQYYQAEIVAYFSNNTRFSGLFGNRGNPGDGSNQSASITVPNNIIKKVVFDNNGEAGSTFSLYQLPSADIQDWFDRSNLLAQLTISDIFTADESEIMPFVIPQNGANSLFVGMILP